MTSSPPHYPLLEVRALSWAHYIVAAAALPSYDGVSETDDIDRSVLVSARKLQTWGANQFPRGNWLLFARTPLAAALAPSTAPTKSP